MGLAVGPAHVGSLWQFSGTVYYDLGQYRNALNDFTEVIGQNPSDPDAYFALGTIYYDLGRYRPSTTSVAGSAVTPTHAGLQQPGLAYARLDQFELAVADFDRAIELDTGFALAYNNLGFAR